MKEQYEKLKGTKVHYKSNYHDSTGVIVGYEEHHLIMRVTNGTHGWNEQFYSSNKLFIHNEGKTSPKGYLYLIDSNHSSWKVIFKFGR